MNVESAVICTNRQGSSLAELRVSCVAGWKTLQHFNVQPYFSIQTDYSFSISYKAIQRPKSNASYVFDSNFRDSLLMRLAMRTYAKAGRSALGVHATIILQK